ncbi:MAG: beta-propeller domain-containing protein [Desulfotomaculaceae bacterium]
MRKIIFYGIILLTMTTFLVFRSHPGANAEPNHTATFIIDQRTYVTDSQAKSMDAAPFIENGRSFVPARYLALALGVPEDKIIWNSSSSTLTLVRDDVTVSLATGSNIIYIDDLPLTMDVAPVLRNDRTYLPARYIAEAFGYSVGWDGAVKAVLIGPPGNLPQPSQDVLPVVGTYENLKDLLEKSQVLTRVGIMNDMAIAPGVVGSAPPRAAQESKSTAAAPTAGAGLSDTNAADYSKTNTQVEGVDEADIVKTDGTYIYQVNRERIIIARAAPPEDMEVISVLNYTGKDFSPQEMYVDDNHLVVIGSTRTYGIHPLYSENGASPGLKIMPPYNYYREMVKAVIYNIEDKSSIKQERELELNGNYVSSRKVGQSLYLIANKNIYFYPGREIEEPKPLYRDSVVSDNFNEIDYPSIRCFPDFVEPSYLMVAGLNLDQPDEKANVSSFLGSGQNVYASTENLYVAVTGYSYYREPFADIMPPTDMSKTKIYKFQINEGQLSYAASGEAPGTILNQFSMDEHEGYFRIATTSGDVWRAGAYTSQNNLYVLDSSLAVVGKIEGIAPGEKIYSVRFTGDRGYIVTFKTVDPFFVLDLTDPQHPGILGALKIPGYSDYLHPYDDNHIIGFGKDTVEMSGNGWNGSPGESMAFYMGMKMAIFDVSDVSNPVEMFRANIGDRGTDSELLRNHKALLFAKDKNLLAFPVTVMEVKGDGYNSGSTVPEYGTFTFQGAYVYNIDLASGFTLKGRITHLSGEDYLKAGNYWYNSEKDIERIVYIDDTLYTLSQRMLKANQIDDLQEVSSLEIK